MSDNLGEEVYRLLETARGLFSLGDYVGAASAYKAALRQIRDKLGAADLAIADVFEELSRVHAATGQFHKCDSIRNRMRVIRAASSKPWTRISRQGDGYE